MKRDIPFGYWKTRAYIRTLPLSYLIRLRRQLTRHSSFRWAVAAEVNRRLSAAESV